MTKKTVFDVIDMGVNYLVSVYDKWGVEEVLDNQNEVFPNTLHWQYGHVLTIFESALSLCEQNEVDIALYSSLFGYGSSPKDWNDADVPSIDEIINNIKTLPDRARNLTDVQLEQELSETIAGCNTLDELLTLNAIHIPLHAGKIEEMTRVLKSER
ncbi:bacillithiol transferase BstA [Staphylococcus sp. 18_1_E_LY]|uniref:Bacillithiol transferase BstA n=1 Tax=Staphylococcus lloydii TaxID=2781774 RepID=A0A7T1B1H9_9STAP|nr:bacillithiol transferase BstA [Staphylococcus lloydii]MBF7020598.1 bacillithiol transferase BstA [Staphylococcus lloydii]MBF7028281.1 bacillithiol transferase BstA [Staphylococcus lloydii]QPM75994.1 bacillithiol transferase BstA [Staphylococcus lloydii]